MSHFSADAPAIVLGGGVGIAAGLYARHALRRAASQGESDDALTLPGWLLAVLGGLTGALIGARFGMQARLPAYLYLVAITPALGAIDATTRKLPNRILLPAYPASAALLGLTAWHDSGSAAMWRGALAGALLFAVFLVVALAAPVGSLGWGDVKLVGVLGLLLGFLGWATVWQGMMIAFGLAALYVALRTLVQHGQHGQSLPLGPALLIGSLTAVIVS
ncbi:hypothetical protein GCM10009839_88820 [Catenulispora yoronensis]|uniref:Prepilin type IV endopeptidase peptidase domain-containing protein n=1 Tax=Catenulispora yoronensis TaxID=450799 RepID=A0ABP5H6C4_9ACTN